MHFVGHDHNLKSQKSFKQNTHTHKMENKVKSYEKKKKKETKGFI